MPFREIHEFYHFQLVTEYILSWCLWSHEALFKFLVVLKELVRDSYEMDALEDLKMRVTEPLALMARDFPISLQVSKLIFESIISLISNSISKNLEKVVTSPSASKFT